MTEKFPLHPEQPEQQPEKGAEFERLVTEEMTRLREERERILKETSREAMENLTMIIPPSSETGLRKMAEQKVRARFKTEEQKRALEREKRYLQAEGPTEEELEEIAKRRLEKRGK